MNHIYRVVYNHHTHTYQAVSEISKGAHKTHSECNQDGTFTQSSLGNVPFFRTALTTLAVVITALGAQHAHAAPTDGQVVAGQANIAQAGAVTNIHQASQNAVINWQQFGIKADETVNFKQPNAQSVTLNRVIGNEKSVIDGAMNANGKVFITNPNGVMIGNGAKINVGALLATTGKISDSDFMAGNYRFQDAKGVIENYGEITVPEGGAVALIAPVVRNQGTITAPQGNALLASAEQFSVTLQDDNFAYTLDKGTLQGLVDNGGAIYADAGHIVLTAKGVDMVKKSLIKHSGIAEANTVRSKNGVIELLGDLDNSALNVSGSLKAEAKASGDGGFIETSAAQVKIEDNTEVSTKAENGKTGTWLIDPNDIIIASGAGKKPDGTAYTTNEITATGKTIQDSLARTGVIIESTKGKSNGKGDVIIDDEISWNANPLKLVAQNDIHINKTLNGTGTASLALEYGQGSKDGKYKATVDGKETTLDNDYYLDKNTPLKDRTVKINLPEGQSFSTKKGSQGATNEFTVIHQMPEISKNADGDWVSQFTVKNIALGADMDVSHTRNYEGFAGWDTPVESNELVHGLGHVVDGLWLRSKKDHQRTGLFTENAHGEIRDIGVTNVDISSEGANSFTGGLVGLGHNITNSYATGTVSTTGYNAHAGGLVGIGNTITNSYATGTVSTTGGGADAGGLVGIGNNITNSYATGTVSTTGDYADAGGLVGSGNNITNSYATGTVSTTGDYAQAGGLVGIGNTITNSYATGTVSTTGDYADAGGLVGLGNNITNSYATGTVSTTGGGAQAGGLVGLGHNITNSYATGTVSTTGYNAHAGGLVGIGYTTNSYANNPLVSASGQNATAGGVVGRFYNYRDSNYYLTNNFYNQDKQPTVQAVGSIEYTSQPANITNTVGKSDAELKQQSTFKDWDFDTVWTIEDGKDYPRLRGIDNLANNNTPVASTTPNTPNNPTTPTQPNNPTTPVVPVIPQIPVSYPNDANKEVSWLNKVQDWQKATASSAPSLFFTANGLVKDFEVFFPSKNDFYYSAYMHKLNLDGITSAEKIDDLNKIYSKFTKFDKEKLIPETGKFGKTLDFVDKTGKVLQALDYGVMLGEILVEDGTAKEKIDRNWWGVVYSSTDLYTGAISQNPYLGIPFLVINSSVAITELATGGDLNGALKMDIESAQKIVSNFENYTNLLIKQYAQGKISRDEIIKQFNTKKIESYDALTEINEHLMVTEDDGFLEKANKAGNFFINLIKNKGTKEMDKLQEVLNQASSEIDGLRIESIIDKMQPVSKP